jgi:hypothetical protein
MNTELDTIIANAYAQEGKQEAVNKVYFTLLKTTLYVPVETSQDNKLQAEEPFSPLFTLVEEYAFMVAFDELARLQQWAGDQFAAIDYVSMSGKEVLSAIGDKVYLALNPGYPYYKEFSPEEIYKLKTMVSRINQFKEG